jgi:cellobiose phosphorylase
MKELSILLDRLSEPVNYNKFWEKQKQLKKYLKNIENINGKTIRVNIDDLIYDLKEKSAHLSRWLKKKEWLKTNFFNGYYDEQGKRAEGKINGRMRMLLPSQVFPIMSKIASQEQIERAWKSIKSHLKDKRLGGFRLNTDFGSLYLSLGRAFGFVYGDKENGAFFNHMVIMFAYALYKRNFIKEASEVFGSIYRMATAEEGKIYPGIPEYFNNQGSGLYLYLTGSASWYIHTLLEEVLGIKFVLGNLILEPKIAPVYFSGNAIEVSYTQGGKRINISYIKGKKNLPSGIEKLTAQGRLINSCNGKYILEKESLNKIKAKEIKIKVYLH